MPEDEIEAIVARLRHEVRATAGTSAEENGSPGRLAARAEAESLWAVAADKPFPAWPGWRSLRRRWGWTGLLKRSVVVPVKVVVRKLIRWYVDPLASEQRRFNEVTLRLIDELDERLRAQQEEIVRLRGLVERSPAAPSPPGP